MKRIGLEHAESLCLVALFPRGWGGLAVRGRVPSSPPSLQCPPRPRLQCPPRPRLSSALLAPVSPVPSSPPSLQCPPRPPLSSALLAPVSSALLAPSLQCPPRPLSPVPSSPPSPVPSSPPSPVLPVLTFTHPLSPPPPPPVPSPPQNAAVSCQKRPCPLQCSHPVPSESCCPACDSCLYQGGVHAHGHAFGSASDPCQRCACVRGTVTCARTLCPPAPCPRPVTPPGQCCPRCPPGRAPRVPPVPPR
ncbi:unnamed protein product [Boreogadus saida]